LQLVHQHPDFFNVEAVLTFDMNVLGMHEVHAALQPHTLQGKRNASFSAVRIASLTKMTELPRAGQSGAWTSGTCQLQVHEPDECVGNDFGLGLASKHETEGCHGGSALPTHRCVVKAAEDTSEEWRQLVGKQSRTEGLKDASLQQKTSKRESKPHLCLLESCL
jgi:hypothetical protein